MSQTTEAEKTLVWLGFVAAAMVVLAAILSGAIRQQLHATPPAAASPAKPGVGPTGASIRLQPQRMNA